MVIGKPISIDTLVEETMAFAKSVRVEPPIPRTVVEPNRMLDRVRASEEIRHRVANFKAHQPRFIREREDYATSVFKQMLASRQ